MNAAKKYLYAFVICIFLVSSIGYAIYYKIPVFARPAALGEAVVSDLGYASNIFYNPAGINTNNISFSLTDWFLDTRAGSCAGSYNVGGYFSVGAGISNFSYGQMRYYDEQGNPGEYFNAGLWQYRVTLAKQFNNKVSVGIGTKVLYQKIETSQETKVSPDIGIVYTTKLFNIGATIQNLEICDDATMYNIGLTVKPIDNLLILGALDYQEETVLKSGIEYYFKPIFLRIGYSDKRISCGIGYLSKGFSFDYALTDYGQIGLTHQFSITVK